MAKRNLPHLMAFLESKHNANFGHIWLRFLEVANSNLPNAPGKAESVYDSKYDNLYFMGQLGGVSSEDFERKDVANAVYGDKFGFIFPRADRPLRLSDLNGHRTVLAPIERKLQNYNSRFGCVKNFAEQAMRIMDALNIKHLTIINSDRYIHYSGEARIHEINNRIAQLLGSLGLLKQPE